MDDFQSNGDANVDLEDEDDMFKSARAIEPEPVKREVNIFGDENSDTDAVELDNSTPDKEIPLEDEDEKPFEVIQSVWYANNSFVQLYLRHVLKYKMHIHYNTAQSFLILETSVLYKDNITSFIDNVACICTWKGFLMCQLLQQTNSHKIKTLYTHSIRT